MELIHLRVMWPPRHGVLRIVASADANIAAVLDDVMEATIYAISPDLRKPVGSWRIHALCSATARADMPTLTIPAASSEGVPAECFAVADLPNPLDAFGGAAKLMLAKHGALGIGRVWRLFFIPNTKPERTDGMLLHVCGVLTKRYRADRHIFYAGARIGAEEVAVYFREFDRVLRRATGLPARLEAVAVFDCDTNEDVPCRLDDFDAFGTNWIVLDKPCRADTTLRFELGLLHNDDCEVKFTFWKRLPKWPRDDRHAWTRCCVDAVL